MTRERMSGNYFEIHKAGERHELSGIIRLLELEKNRSAARKLEQFLSSEIEQARSSGEGRHTAPEGSLFSIVMSPYHTARTRGFFIDDDIADRGPILRGHEDYAEEDPFLFWADRIEAVDQVASGVVAIDSRNGLFMSLDPSIDSITIVPDMRTS